MDDQIEQERIRRRAYELWEREGSPEGRADEFWQQAVSSIEAEDSTQGLSGVESAGADADTQPSDVERATSAKSGSTES